MFRPSYLSPVDTSYGDTTDEGSAPAAPATTSAAAPASSTDYTEYLKYAQMGLPVVAGLFDTQTTRERVEELKAKIKNWKSLRDNAKISLTRTIYASQVNKLEGELRAAEAELAEEERTAWVGDAGRILAVGAGIAGLFLVVQYGRRLTR